MYSRLDNEPRRIECLFKNYDSRQSLDSDKLKEVLVNEGIVSPSEIIIEAGEHCVCVSHIAAGIYQS